MFRFRIIGFVGDVNTYYGDMPVDITVYETNQEQAIAKAESIIGKPISYLRRKIIIEEIEVGKRGDEE